MKNQTATEFSSPLPSVTPDDSGHICGTDPKGTTCQACNLYKWYPPLLLLSTIMAGIFCSLYLTKPVFLAPPGGAHPATVNPAIEHQRALPLVEDLEPKTAQAPGPARLNPEMASLPGEAPVAAPPVAELEPLNVVRRSTGLFKPFEPAPMTAAIPRDVPVAVILDETEGGPIRINRSEQTTALRIVQRDPDPEPAVAEKVSVEPSAGEELAAVSTFDQSPLLSGPVLSPEAAPSAGDDDFAAEEAPLGRDPVLDIGASFLSEFAERAVEFASLDTEDPALDNVP